MGKKFTAQDVKLLKLFLKIFVIFWGAFIVVTMGVYGAIADNFQL